MLDAFSTPGRFFRGNLHGHSTRSDGALDPGEVCARYRREGYDFVTLSDHFIERFGFPVTDTRAMRADGFTTVLGAEVHSGETSRGIVWHILAVGLPLDFAPTRPDETGPELARRCAEAGAFVAVAHPHWYNLTEADALQIDVAHAVEVYNHTCQVNADRGYGDDLWDALLHAGRAVGGIAVDDSHWKEDDAFGGWVMVKAQENAPEALLAALKAGCFYASQGPVIEDVRREGDEIVVRSTPIVRASLQGPGALSTMARGVSMTQARLDVKAAAGGWRRLTVTDAAGRCAWTNPLFLD